MKCSILVANYNSSSFIDEFLRSIINQNYENWEVIVVDDCSTDDSVSRILPYSHNFDIKVIINSTNKGVGYTKRLAANHAIGELLLFADPDDALAFNALSMMVDAHRKYPNASLIYSTFYQCDENLKVVSIPGWVGEITKPFTNLHLDRISHLATFKAEYYRMTSGINADLKAAVDKDIFYKLEEVGAVHFINTPLYYYRKNIKGVSQSKNAIQASKYSLNVIKDAYRRRQSSGFSNLSPKEIKTKEAIHYQNESLFNALNGDVCNSFYALAKSVMNDPFIKYFERIKLILLYYQIKNLLR